MSLVRFEPLSLVDRINKDSPRRWGPAVDILEQKDRFVVRADLPGVDPADIEVSMEKGILSVAGERQSEGRSEIAGVARYERAAGRFLRRFALPDTADAEAISAKCSNGILEISIPKQAAIQARRIIVDAA
ncbi:MAG: Hsp20/alpha crystallin family protein [Proteobacteria bacterium]|nr:Hsp20/alpha crystallin family protein [Pseudomonadota bacterium]MDA1064445.1 Hsp20/alpha crystallin family protein [Pseudomonadota bacterium]